MSELEQNAEWTLPVLDSEPKPMRSDGESKLSNAAWTSVAIGVVTKKILKNEANEEYPFEIDKEL